MLKVYFNSGLLPEAVDAFLSILKPLEVRGTGPVDWNSGPTLSGETTKEYQHQLTPAIKVAKDAVAAFFSKTGVVVPLSFTVLSDGAGSVLALIDYYRPGIETDPLFKIFPYLRIESTIKELGGLETLLPIDNYLSVDTCDWLNRWSKLLVALKANTTLMFDPLKKEYTTTMKVGVFNLESIGLRSAVRCYHRLASELCSRLGYDDHFSDEYFCIETSSPAGLKPTLS